MDGYLVPPGDAIALARRILDVLGSGDRRREMGLQGRRRIRADFDFEVQAIRFLRVCQEIVSSRCSNATMADLAPKSEVTR